MHLNPKVISFLIFIFFNSCTNNNNNSVNSEVIYNVKTFEVNDSSGKLNGWGYDVFKNNTKMIHQKVIPGKEGNQFFNSKNSAMAIGNLVISKLKANPNDLPTILPFEIDSVLNSIK